jgi:hypothetical protein
MSEQPEIVWQDPPPAAPSWHHRFEAVAATLRQNPNRWARVAEYSTANGAQVSASKINNHGTRYFTKGEFEATARVEGDQYFLYVRYVG